MIKSLTFTNCFGRSLRCILEEPNLTGIAITQVSGLGPGASSVNIHEIATADGGYFGSARFSSRNILLSIQLCDFFSDGVYVPIEQIRHLAYEFFAPRTLLQIAVETDSRTLVIEGVTETDDPSIFEKAEKISISILCPGYYFKMASDTGTNQSVVVYGKGSFQFPFSNESLARKRIRFGELSLIQKNELYYDGDAETGFELEIAFTGEMVREFTIQNKPLGNSEKGPIGFLSSSDSSRAIFRWKDASISSKTISLDLETVATKLGSRYTDPIYSAGNRIIICSSVGKKSAFFVDSRDNRYSILNAFSHLDWLKLYPGYNEFTITTDVTSLGHFIVTAKYEALYTGV